MEETVTFGDASTGELRNNGTDLIVEADLTEAGEEDNWDFKDEYVLIDDLGVDDLLFCVFFNTT